MTKEQPTVHPLERAEQTESSSPGSSQNQRLATPSAGRLSIEATNQTPPDEVSGVCSAAKYFLEERHRPSVGTLRVRSARPRTSSMRATGKSANDGEDADGETHHQSAEILTVDEAALRLRRDRKSIYKAIKRGEFPGVLPGTPTRILWSAVLASASTGQGHGPKKRGR